MKPTCKKRIYLTKQSGPRTKYVTPGSMLREITEQTPLKREAEILRACTQSRTAGWRMIKTGVTRLGNGWIQDGVKFVDYVIPLIPNHAAAGFGTSFARRSERLVDFHPRRTGGKGRAYATHVATHGRVLWKSPSRLPVRRCRLNVANVTR